MARIPTPGSEVSARSGRTTGGVPSRTATAEAFGAGTGRGLQSLAAGVDRVGQGLNARDDALRAEDVANRVAQSDFTRRELELRNEVGSNAAGYQEQTLEAYDAWVDEQAEAIEDDRTRTEFRQRMANQRNSVSSRAAQWEFGTAAQNSRDQADASLTALDNKIRLDPTGYDDFIEQGFAVIDARDGIPASVREQMKETWRENAALSRFEGMLEGASTLEDIQALQSELREGGEREWSAELSSAGLERVTSLADAASRSIQTRADADARAAIEFLEGRASDVTTLIPREELMAAQEVVGKSNNPVTAARLARIVRDQEIIAQTRSLTPAQQRDVLETRYNNPSLPSRLNTAITRAANLFGVSPAYLAATAQREYGVFLDGENTDYGQGNIGNNSSATGVMQFIDGTWLGVVRSPEFQAAVGLDISGMSNAQLLELRKDPEMAMMGGAFFTANNARLARAALGREPTDADLYIMHFMGEGGGPRLFRLVQSNPNMSGAHLFPEQAAANRSVYYNRDGSARTVREVYNELGRLHGSDEAGETYIEYGDRQTREDILSDSETRIADDPMSFALQTGNANLGDIFEPGGMAARGEQARAVADMYSIPQSDMQPFTNDEATQIAEQFSNGSADDVLGILTAIQEMGGPMARAAMNQIGDVSDVYAYAGGLQLETGQGAVAAEVVRGQKRLDENPDIANQVGASPRELSDAFMNSTGGALLDAAPDQRQAIMDAALAHYVETQVARGRAGQFNQDAFTSSVQAVLGARQGAPSVDTVNGSKTVMPPGVTGRTLEQAFDNMTVADWTTMSEQGLPPRYVTGEIADPEDLSDEAQLRAIGGGKYRVMTSDGNYLVTGNRAPNGQLEPYIFVPTSDAINEVNAQAETRAEETRQGVLDEARQNAAPGTRIEQTAMGPRTVTDGPQSQEQADARADLDLAEQDGELTQEEMIALFEKYGYDVVQRAMDL